MRAVLGLAALLLLAGCQGRAAEPPSDRLSIAPQVFRVQEDVCSAGAWSIPGQGCVAAAIAFTAEGGTAYWVDQRAPRASDANPGTREAPWRTIGRAASALGPGDAVIIRAGIYRETVTPRRGGAGPGQRITYAAYPGETVVVTGANPVDGWLRDGDAWRLRWPGPPMPSYAEGDPVFRRELVVASSTVLRPVYRRAALRAGTFLAEGPDTAPRALLARFPANRAPRNVEVGVRTYLFRPLGRDPEPACGSPETPGWLRVVGITFVHAANRAQWGAVCFGREGALVENVTVRWTNGLGVDVSGQGHVFRNVAADYNGQMGFGGACVGCLFEDTRAVGNNWKGHDPFWEAGGGKWRHTRETVFRRHLAADNDGPGLWLDGSNDRNTIEGCRLENNQVAALMLELETTRTLVQHNVLAGTRWRGYSGAGFLSQAASRNAIVHNTITGNEGTGLWLRLDPLRRAEDGHTRIYNNLIVGNARTPVEEAREITIEGATLQHARSTRLDGNVYGRRATDDLRASTFFFMPDAASPADFRSGDLARWQRLTGGDGQAVLVALEEEWTGPSASLPAALEAYGASTSGPVPYAHPGADPDRVRARRDR